MTGKPALASVFVIDDDEAVRDSLRALLEAKSYAVKTYASGQEFLLAYAVDERGCALIDLRMPGMDGLALIEQLKSRGARLPVVVVTGHGDIPLAVQAMKAGAADFIEKPYTGDRILGAVRQALATASAAPTAADTAAASGRLSSLTRREREVLDRLVIGRPNKIIAHELHISPRTVEIHRANLMRKMEAESLSHLVRLALAAGIRTEPQSS
jgi:two-component system, LuxR family, response regulator FixJ